MGVRKLPTPCQFARFEPSRSGEQKHRRRGEPPCEQCADDYRRWARQYRQSDIWPGKKPSEKAKRRVRANLRKQVGHLLPWYCARCHATAEMTIDHITPISRGGGNNLKNLQVLCRPCNIWKAVDDTDYRDSDYKQRMKELARIHKPPKPKRKSG